MLKPLGDRVVIEPVKEATTTKGGIVLPDSAQGKPVRGKVVAVGNGKLLDNGTRVPVDLKEGDIIIFAQYGGTNVEYDGTEYTILNERDVLAVVE
ncbi:chaperonin GroES [Deinobacterium chartae]|uniref:Co-chaperonin GroES n=1 Tax=Deinobacterium chartae TaxID=521158 RepID=A0A841I524_9DEIO|nr:co-chaperone GroES [Deinobacterium chartae]MBB6099052.1 chaperonin GroES [Deinobacterium chartae]